MNVCKLFESNYTIWQIEENFRTVTGRKDCFLSNLSCSLEPFTKNAGDIKFCQSLKDSLNDKQFKDRKVQLLIERASHAKEMMKIKVWGSLLHELTSLCGFSAKVRLLMIHNDDHRELFQIPDMEIYSGKAESENLLGCCNKTVTGPKSFANWNGNQKFFVSLLLVCQMDITKHNQNMNIFQNAINSPDCNVTIIGANDATITCHKAVLKEQSDIVAKLLESGPGVIRLGDLSEIGLKALLEYFYTKNVSIVKSTFTSELAKELFKVANQYKIKELKSSLGEYMNDMPNYYFSIGSALAMFKFGVYEEDCQNLMEDSIEHLKTIPKTELTSCETYRKFCFEDPKLAEYLCILFRDNVTDEMMNY